MNFNSTESNIFPKFNYRDLMIFLAPFLIFSLYLFVYEPGVLTVASYSQLHQIAAGKFTAAYPILHTLLEITCLKIFNNTFFIGVFQILIFSVLWTIICKYHRNDLSNNSNVFVLQFIVTLIICLIPINAVYSITLSGNVLFSYSLMFLCFLIKIIIDRNGQIGNKLIILIALTLAIISGLNNYGTYIALISLITIVFYLYRKNTHQNVFIKLIGITIVCILLMGSLNLIYDVKSSTYDAYTDNVNVPMNDAFEEGVNLESAKNQFFSTTHYEPSEDYEDSSSGNLGNIKYTLVDSYVNLFRESTILDSLFNNPILYMIFSIILIGLIYFINKQNLLLIYVPNIINTIIVLLTGQDNLYSNLLVFYLIVIILISIYYKQNPKVDNIRNITPPRTVQKENYVEDNYYSDLESEIGELTLNDINEILGKTLSEKKLEIEQTEQNIPQGDSDLIDEILKEIEMERK